MAKPGGGTIIVKKIRKGGHDAHHGGAWKVAYADFVTAMMAFFLLLWLLNVTTDVQKRGIADYFEPTIALKSPDSGSGGILGGRVIGKPGMSALSSAAPSVSVPVPSLRQPDDGEDGDEAGEPGKSEKPSRDDKPSQGEMQKQLAAREEQQFAAAEFQLRQTIQDVPELRELAENLIIDRTPEGLRIQLVDQDRRSMFPLGSTQIEDAAKKLMAQVAVVVAKLPNKISVTGHTDATPYVGRSNYGNWELSAERANASRRELAAAGLGPERIAKVVGMADREPLIADQPTSPQNRRISIVLLREAKPQTTASAEAAPKKLAQK